jgi:hypothetical protein
VKKVERVADGRSDAMLRSAPNMFSQAYLTLVVIMSQSASLLVRI